MNEAAEVEYVEKCDNNIASLYLYNLNRLARHLSLVGPYKDIASRRYSFSFPVNNKPNSCMR